MICKQCGAQFEGNFCPKCGTPAQEEMTVCPKCGQGRADGDRYCSKCGYDFTPPLKKRTAIACTKTVTALKAVSSKVCAAAKKIPLKTWIFWSVLVIIVIVILICNAVNNAVNRNIFRIDKVDDIVLGNSKQTVNKVLGEPYRYQESSLTFTYYSSGYLKLLEKNDNFDPDDIEDWNDFEDAFEEAAKLEQKLQTKKHKYIEVRFDADGYVTSVFFDNARREQTKDKRKTFKEYEVLEISESEVEYSVTYKDGSYYLGTAAGTLGERDGETFLLWNDRFGNELEILYESDFPAADHHFS